MEIKKCLIAGISLLALLMLPGCLESPNITGSDDVIEFSNVSFETTALTGTASRLTATGTILNSGNSVFYAPWYIEGDFYADDNYEFKLGGDQYSITFSLEPGETTGWQLDFSSSLYTEGDYPNFAIKNLRAFRDEN